MNKHNINVGDTVKVIGNSNSHGFYIGQLVTVDKIIEEFGPREVIKCYDNKCYWYLRREDIELIKTTSTTKTHTFDGWAVFDKTGLLVYYNHEPPPLSMTFLNKELGRVTKKATITVKIKQDGKED